MKFILLTQGLTTQVDDADFDVLNCHKWHAVKNGHSFYAARAFGGSKCQIRLTMHAEIMQPRYPLIVDHIDGNGLNNTRMNLRIVTQRQNLQNRHHSKNTSEYPGVYWNERRKKWVAQIRVPNTTQRHIGYFESEKDAYAAYKERSDTLLP